MQFIIPVEVKFDFRVVMFGFKGFGGEGFF